MTVLFRLQLLQLVREFKDLLVGIQVSLILILNAFFGKDASNALHVFIGAPVDVQNFILVVAELVLRAAYYAKVGGSLFAKSNWDLVLDEHLVSTWVLHLLEHDTLLHLPDVLFLNNPHQLCELLINKLWAELVVFCEALVHERVTALL